MGALGVEAMGSYGENICPICERLVKDELKRSGPFCSRRCQMIDLGKWFGEEYRFTEELRPEHFAEFEELSGGEELDEV